MSSEQRWRVYINNLETRIRVGIHAHEQEPQRVLVSASIEIDGPVHPQSIGDCFNYDYLRDRIIKTWPQRPHTKLLESCVVDLLDYIFRLDERVCLARVSVSKPDILPEADAVGVEAQWTRADFDRLILRPKP